MPRSPSNPGTETTPRLAGTLALLIVGWWTLHGLLLAGQMLAMERPDGSAMATLDALRLGLASGWLWIPLTLLLAWWVLHHPIEPGRMGRALAATLVVVLAIVLLRAGAVFVLNPLIGWYPRLPGFAELARTSLSNNLLLLWLLVGALHAWLYAQRARQRQRETERLETRLVQSRLDALQTQLNPHLLFNTLNSVAEMVHRDANAAERMLVDLGALLRASLDRQGTHEVCLRDELRLLRHYLDIEKVRLGERLSVEWTVDPALESALVPALLLQPLAENAILHAIATRREGGTLRVTIQRIGDELELAVADDGGSGDPRAHSGIGLANLHDRLHCLYGDRQSLRLSTDDEHGSVVRVRLPLRLAPDALS